MAFATPAMRTIINILDQSSIGIIYINKRVYQNAIDIQVVYLYLCLFLQSWMISMDFIMRLLIGKFDIDIHH